MPKGSLRLMMNSQYYFFSPSVINSCIQEFQQEFIYLISIYIWRPDRFVSCASCLKINTMRSCTLLMPSTSTGCVYQYKYSGFSHEHILLRLIPFPKGVDCRPLAFVQFDRASSQVVGGSQDVNCKAITEQFSGDGGVMHQLLLVLSVLYQKGNSHAPKASTHIN